MRGREISRVVSDNQKCLHAGFSSEQEMMVLSKDVVHDCSLLCWGLLHPQPRIALHDAAQSYKSSSLAQKHAKPLASNAEGQSRATAGPRLFLNDIQMTEARPRILRTAFHNQPLLSLSSIYLHSASCSPKKQQWLPTAISQRLSPQQEKRSLRHNSFPHQSPH